MTDAKGGSAGRQDIDTTGTGTNLTALPQRVVSPNVIEGQEYRQVLELKLIGKLTKASTTPSVINNEHWIADNAAPITILNFDNGQDGQHLYILGDGQTTVDSNAKIINATGAPELLALNEIAHYVMIDNIWYEICCSTGGGGGSVAWTDITGKPSVFPPDYVGFPPPPTAWIDITGKPATFPPDYVGFPPAWTSITGKPSTFPPDYITFPPAWGAITGTPTTLAGYGITDAYTKTATDTLLAGKANVATTLAGYGITDAYTKTATDALLAGKANTATTLAGYGITDAYTKTAVDTLLAGKANTATTLAGYGITDAYTKTAVDTLLLGKANTATTLAGYGITDAVAIAGAQTITGVKTFSAAQGLIMAAASPVFALNNTTLTVTTGGLWGIQSTTDTLRVLRNSAVAGDFSSGALALNVNLTNVKVYADSLFLDIGVTNPTNPIIKNNGVYAQIFGPHVTTPAEIQVGSNTDPAIYLDADNVWFRTQGGGANSMRLIRSGSAVTLRPMGTTNNLGDATTGWDAVNIQTGGALNVASTKVVGTRQTGWNAPTGTLTRGTFSTAPAFTSAGLNAVAQALGALITDLRTHGLINT